MAFLNEAPIIDTREAVSIRYEIKVFTLILAHYLLTDEFQAKQEAMLSEYLNGGWQIIASGGYGGDLGGDDGTFAWGIGFLVLRRLVTDKNGHANSRNY